MAVRFFWVLASILTLSACARHAKIAPKTLVIGIENEIKNLDLRYAQDANSVHIARLMTQGLISINEELLPEPELALSFEVIGGKKFIFKLPSDVSFQDGHRLTSADVKYSFVQASG